MPIACCRFCTRWPSTWLHSEVGGKPCTSRACLHAVTKSRRRLPSGSAPASRNASYAHGSKRVLARTSDRWPIVNFNERLHRSSQTDVTGQQRCTGRATGFFACHDGGQRSDGNGRRLFDRLSGRCCFCAWKRWS